MTRGVKEGQEAGGADKCLLVSGFFASDESSFMKGS